MSLTSFYKLNSGNSSLDLYVSNAHSLYEGWQVARARHQSSQPESSPNFTGEAGCKVAKIDPSPDPLVNLDPANVRWKRMPLGKNFR